jgi:cysteine desulfurase
LAELLGIQLEKLTSKRHYLDFNATSPFAPSVSEWLAKGDLLFANPSSVHATGKRGRKFLNEARAHIYKTFQLDPKEFHLIFHSGASEGVNALVKGRALSLMEEGKTLNFFRSASDHSSVRNMESDLELLGHKMTIFPVLDTGEIDAGSLIEMIKKAKGEVLLNFTPMNNETGVCWDWALASKIKEETGCLVHMDTVQTVGKVPGWNQLDNKMDLFTYSAHKFGALKGVGFSFIKKGFKFRPFISGGGQQGGLRSGTENTMGIYSIKLALEDLENEDLSLIQEAKDLFETRLKELLGDKGHIVGEKAKLRAVNTTSFITPGKISQNTAIQLDMAGIDISTGSACSSGAVIPSKVLLGMGYSDEDAMSAVRVSFGPDFRADQVDEIIEKFKKVLNKIL